MNGKIWSSENSVSRSMGRSESGENEVMTSAQSTSGILCRRSIVGIFGT